MSRKTIPVREFINEINNYIALAKSAPEREILASLARKFLHETGNYKGFGYLDLPYVSGKTDETRIFFYIL